MTVTILIRGEIDGNAVAPIVSAPALPATFLAGTTAGDLRIFRIQSWVAL